AAFVRNGAPETFRARRMREEITISLIGPLPRSHSPARLVRSLSFMILNFGFWTANLVELLQSKIRNRKSKMNLPALRLADLIAELGGPLVVFDFDRLGKLLAELGQIGAAFGRHSGAAAPLGNFPDVMRRSFMGSLNQRRQVFLKKC